MLVLDALIRYSAFSLLLLLIVLLVRDAKDSAPARYAALLSLTSAALLLGTPHPDLTLPEIPHTIVRFLDVPSVVFAWWFGRSLFEDDFRLAWPEWLVMVLIVTPITMFRLSELEIIPMIPSWLIYTLAFMSILLMAHLVFITVSGRDDDLVESRRRIRVHFLIGLAVIIALILVSERVYFEDYPIAVNTSRAAMILILAVWGCLWMLKFQNDKLVFETQGTLEARHDNTPQPRIDPRDHGLHTALIQQMEAEKVYGEAGLSIRALAQRLETPEHRLRALINQGMGYRNFSAFVNKYRIEAVKTAMQQPENSRVPILTLAMNVGFNSLAPFNRAFSNQCGKTPSEYRNELHN